MKKTIEWLKNNLLVICITLILGVTISATAETEVPSVGVSYSNSKTEETTVNGALNELFSAVDINEQLATMKTKITNLESSTEISALVNTMYPVGSIYISTSSTNPGTVFTGTTWEAFGTGKTLVGVDKNDTNFSAAEKTGGASSVKLTTSQLPSHTHSIPALSGTAASAGAHTHTLTATGTIKSTFTGTSATTSSNGAHTHTVSATAASAGSHTHTVWGQGFYYTDNYTNNQERISMAAWQLTVDPVYTIGGAYAAGAHTHSVSGTAASAGAHTHTLTAAGTVSSTFTGTSATSSSNGAHTHNVSTNASTTGANGSGSAISVQNPYVTVYMWKRTK